MWTLLYVATTFLAQTLESQPEIPWWLAVALGPVGLTAFLLWYSYTLRKELKEKVAEKDAEIARLNEERRKDLVSGMSYREGQTEKLLEHDQKTRQNLTKLTEALKELGNALEKSDGSTEKIAQSVRAIEVEFANLRGRFDGGAGGSTPDLRT